MELVVLVRVVRQRVRLKIFNVAQLSAAIARPRLILIALAMKVAQTWAIIVRAVIILHAIIAIARVVTIQVVMVLIAVALTIIVTVITLRAAE